MNEHAANQALIDAGIGEEHRKLALGRVTPRVDRTYGTRPNFEPARKAMAVLADLILLTVLDVPAPKKKAGKAARAKRELKKAA